MENVTAELEKIIDRLMNEFSPSQAYTNREFIKEFTSVVPKEYYTQGWNIAKEYFHMGLPKLISTQYGGFWFFAMNELLSLYESSSHTEREKLLKLMEKLNRLYVFIFFNSLVMKYIPYNFNVSLWNQAIERSRTRYFKQGLEWIADKLSQSIVDRLIKKLELRSREKPLLLVKSFYELRHRVAQIVKPVVAVYYKLLTLEKAKYSSHTNDDAYGITSAGFSVLDRFLHWWPLFVEKEGYNIDKFVRKKVSSQCLSSWVDTFLDVIKKTGSAGGFNIYDMHYVLQNMLRGVRDVQFWLSDEKLRSMFVTHLPNIPFEEKPVMCFLQTLYNVFTYFLSKSKTSKRPKKGDMI